MSLGELLKGFSEAINTDIMELDVEDFKDIKTETIMEFPVIISNKAPPAEYPIVFGGVILCER